MGPKDVRGVRLSRDLTLFSTCVRRFSPFLLFVMLKSNLHTKGHVYAGVTSFFYSFSGDNLGYRFEANMASGGPKYKLLPMEDI